MSEIEFTADELVAALEAARAGAAENDPAALTVQELVAALGRNEVNIARRLRRLMAVGLVEVTRKPFTRIDGVETTVPAYRMKRG